LAIVMYPPVLNRLLNFALRILSKPPVQLNLSYGAVLSAAIYQGVLRICSGACLYMVVLAVYPLPLNALPSVIGMHAASFVIGMVSFITPAGLGFREAAFACFLRIYMPFPDAVVASLLARLLSTVAEFANAGAAAFIGRSRLTSPQQMSSYGQATETAAIGVEEEGV
jgi:glycosyltransferase 2 family protein